MEYLAKALVDGGGVVDYRVEAANERKAMHKVMSLHNAIGQPLVSNPSVVPFEEHGSTA